MVLDNPILRREGLPRFWRRGSAWRRKALLAAYVALAAAPAAAIVYWWKDLPPEVGAAGLMALAYWPSFLAPVIAPALAAGAIAGERERRTWDLLVLTRLTASEIVWGKLLSRLMPLALVTAALLPLLAALLVRSVGADLWGGLMKGSPVSMRMPAWGWPSALLGWGSGLAVTFANGVMALYVSFRCSSTRAALLVAYGMAVGAYVLVTMVVGAIWMLAFAPVMRTWALSASGPSSAPPPLVTQGMQWIAVVGQAAPFLWGIIVPAVLLPVMVRGFARVDARTRAA